LDWCTPGLCFNGTSLVIYADAPLLTPPVFVSSITYGNSGSMTIGSDGHAVSIAVPSPIIGAGLPDLRGRRPARLVATAAEKGLTIGDSKRALRVTDEGTL
jgi:hypothetical protein